MNQLAMLSKAAEAGARIGEQLKSRAEARPTNQAQGLAEIGFRLSEGETFKFS